MLTTEVMNDIATALEKVTKLTHNTEHILLGPIPVLDEDGLDQLGTLECGENWAWYFEPKPGPDAPEDAMDAPRLRAVEDMQPPVYGDLSAYNGSSYGSKVKA